MICTGCGLELPAKRGSGRKLYYHGPTCRQRARRARMVDTHAELLAMLDHVDTVTAELRHAILAGIEIPGDVIGQLRAVVTAAEQDRSPAVVTPTPVPASAVNDPNIEDVVDSSPEPAAQEPEPSAASAELDLDSVRKVRDPEMGSYTILAGPADDPVVLGYLETAFTGSGKRSGWVPLNAARRLAGENLKDSVRQVVEAHLRIART